MSARLLALCVVIVAFGALSVLALLDVGYVGIIAPHFETWGGGQVFADLVILAVLACLWMIEDARAKGTNAWPYVALTVFTGSFGVLFYLVARELRSGAWRQASA